MTSPSKIVEKKYLVPFILITSLFALWGFANDITNPMVAAFKTVMELTHTKATLIQFAFYGGYATMAIPAALFAQKYSYKKGILLGLGLYATGALLFYPAAQFQLFGFFVGSLYILTFGLAFLETTANPFILSLGSSDTSTRRLNLAQSFNPMGSFLGMIVAAKVVLANLEADKHGVDFSSLDAATKAADRLHDLAVIRDPYVALGLVVLVMLVIIAVVKMPDTAHQEHIHPLQSIKRLLKNKVYRKGVVAQIAYVAAQIMCWTFIIQYAENLGLSKEMGQYHNMVAMGMFIVSRFASTLILKYINASKLLMWFAIGGITTTAGAIFIVGLPGLYCLVATSIFMSLMFPTIYGIALGNVGTDTTMGSAGLVMAIVGGAIMPMLQAVIIDFETVGFLPAVNASFILPLLCFVVIANYGRQSYRLNLKP
ncbi:L-fucose:H+ symporter permease [Carboxylicivirga marina]|uniref:L-fucose:H+ symporter permease n=1 Tax=Carboxylicivirga marina TaxID=2800988 RepID=A0ABS1HNY0_9BACT|nr:L-fucose:H+ symporter permease [Carboxylicivirga marina]MBK3519400.1 L-fucose:H+ symporter permease [Carboxylicivirga marina]